MKRYGLRVIPTSLLLVMTFFLKAQQITKPQTTFNDHYLGETLLDSLSVPEGFTIEIAASKLQSPRMISVGNPDELYVACSEPGEIFRLKDYTGDGTFDEVKAVTALQGIQGITVHKGFLYACTNRELKRAEIKPDGTLAPMETLIDDLPDNGLHGVRTVNVGPDGMLYIAMGTCPDCKTDSNHDDITILKMRPEGNVPKVYAHGLRKTTSIAWHPETKEMWVVDQGLDVNQNVSLEELTRIIETSDDRSLAFADQKGLNNTGPGEAGAKPTEPLLTLPPHSEPVNIIFLGEEARFPAAYLNDALISIHGAWDRENPHGYLVNRIRFVNGMPAGITEFMHGFLSKDGKTRYGRPTGLAVSPKGYLYVSDDFNGVIYKVSALK
ncbi:MAG TPA: hypothetical protein VGK59_21225 [Ohtaekwangia sp.]